MASDENRRDPTGSGAGWISAAGIGTAAAFAAAVGSGALGVGLAASAVAAAGFAWQARRARHERAAASQHLAHTAHELRTPLASVAIALELLRTGQATTPAETAEFLEQADLAARQLEFLIGDVLDDAAMTAGSLRLRCGPLAARTVAGELVQVLGPLAAQRGVTITVPSLDASLRMHADGRRVLQVLFNLVGNAIKFCPRGSRVAIDAEGRDERVRWRVSDDGPGVPAVVQPRLFRAFGNGSLTGSGTSHDVATTGLGLHISRKLVAAMGGRIGYSPGTPRGSVFWFELPTIAQPQTAAQ